MVDIAIDAEPNSAKCNLLTKLFVIHVLCHFYVGVGTVDSSYVSEMYIIIVGSSYQIYRHIFHNTHYKSAKNALA